MNLKLNILIGLLFSLGLTNAASAFPRFRNPVGNSQITASQNYSGNKFFISNFRAPNSSRLRFTIGGAVRNGESCAADSVESSNISALVSSEDTAVTTKSHPVLFAQFPRLNSDKQASLIIKNETESYYQETSVTIPDEGGNIALSFPKNLPGLEIGEDYTWFLQVQCGAIAQVEDPIVQGSISRVSLNMSISNSEPEAIKQFTNSGIWYDSLATAFDLSQQGDSRYWDVLVSSLKK